MTPVLPAPHTAMRRSVAALRHLGLGDEDAYQTLLDLADALMRRLPAEGTALNWLYQVQAHAHTTRAYYAGLRAWADRAGRSAEYTDGGPGRYIYPRPLRAGYREFLATRPPRDRTPEP